MSEPRTWHRQVGPPTPPRRPGATAEAQRGAATETTCLNDGDQVTKSAGKLPMPRLSFTDELVEGQTDVRSVVPAQLADGGQGSSAGLFFATGRHFGADAPRRDLRDSPSIAAICDDKP